MPSRQKNTFALKLTTASLNWIILVTTSLLSKCIPHYTINFCSFSSGINAQKISELNQFRIWFVCSNKIIEYLYTIFVISIECILMACYILVNQNGKYVNLPPVIWIIYIIFYEQLEGSLIVWNCILGNSTMQIINAKIPKSWRWKNNYNFYTYAKYEVKCSHHYAKKSI